MSSIPQLGVLFDWDGVAVDSLFLWPAP